MNECVIEEIKMKHLEENYDIVVVGAGHAGCEAALAGARLGLSTIMFTVSAESIALMPCNPKYVNTLFVFLRLQFPHGTAIQ